MLIRYACIAAIFFPALSMAGKKDSIEKALPVPNNFAYLTHSLPAPAFKKNSISYKKTKSIPKIPKPKVYSSDSYSILKSNKSNKLKNINQKLPLPLKSQKESKYVLGAYGSYNYFRKNDISASYARYNSNYDDSIKVNKRLQGFSPVLVAGFESPINMDKIRLIDKFFLGLKMFYFKGDIKGQMAAFGLDDYICDETESKIKLKNLAVLLNARVYLNSTVFGMEPFIEGGAGLNYYKTKFNVTGDPNQFDTKLNSNSQHDKIYNIGAGVSQEIEDGWFFELIYNYYRSPSIKTAKQAKSGLNLASPIKVNYETNSVSLGFKKEFFE